jgi:N-acetylneuraminic acid mutarotase
LPVAAGSKDSFYVFGGADLQVGTDGKSKRIYRNDAWVYRPKTGWQPLADLPVPLVAAPSPASVGSREEFLILGGDTGEHVGYQPPEQHPGFSRRQLVYNPKINQWRVLSDELPVARVTAPLVQWKDGWLLISGEERPGVRSPEIWQIEERR